MDYLLLAVVVAPAAYLAGRISPDPFRRWERTLRRRAFEWRIWWISEHVRKAEERKTMLVAAMREDA